MSDEKDKERPEWRKAKSGLYVPQGTPEGGRKSTVGFGRALEEGKK